MSTEHLPLLAIQPYPTREVKDPQSGESRIEHFDVEWETGQTRVVTPKEVAFRMQLIASANAERSDVPTA